MGEIPEDIRRAALGVFWRLVERHEQTQEDHAASWSDDATSLIIAKALMAERERCAKIAERYTTRLDVAAAIRQEEGNG